MSPLIFIIIVQGQQDFQVSAWNKAQLNVEDTTFRLSYRDLLFFDLAYSSFRLGGRFIINESALYDTILGERLAQRWFVYQRDPVTLQVGNFYQAFGQGMVLNSFENQALRIDWNIDGVNGRFDSDRLGVNALLGRPRAGSEARPALIAGAEIRSRPVQPYELAFSYLRFDATNTPTDVSFGKPVEERLSVEQKVNIGPVQLLAEAGKRFTWGRYDPRSGWVGTENVDGHAVYGSANLSLRGVGLLVEAKDYYKFNGEFNALPSASASGISLNQGGDERGFRALVQYSPKDFLTVSGSANMARARNGRQKLDEWFGDTRADLGFAIFTPSYLETREQAVESSYPRKTKRTVGLDLIWGPVAAEGRFQFVADSLISGAARSFTDQQASLGYTYQFLTVSVQVERTDKPPDELEKGAWWASVSLHLRLANHNLLVSYGSHRGQLECATGICTWEPPFSGFKVELESRF